MSDPTTPASKPAEAKKPVPAGAREMPVNKGANTNVKPDSLLSSAAAAKFAPPETEMVIPVAEVKWTHHIPLPGKTMNDDFIVTKTEPNGKAWTVEYLPAMQHFRIVHVDPAAKKPEQVRFVHVSHAKVWEPAA